MKKTIWGTIYDTAASKCLGTYRSSLDMTDPRWLEESLYHSKATGHFVKGRGGKQTPYSRTNGISTISPISSFLAGVWIRRVGGQ